jgi:hypothetical protein
MYRRSFQHSKSVRRLLSRSHTPPTELKGSSINGAGRGVFAVESVGAGEILCLYAGVHTPALPPGVDDSLVYLGNNVAPSGEVPDENAYILNLHHVGGGYLDGLALTTEDRTLNENPSACGHYVNHSSSQANVQAVSFAWSDVLNEDEDNDLDHEHLYPLPNIVREDSSPWYLDTCADIIVEYGGGGPNAGAAFCAKDNIEAGDELLLNYGLLQPLPSWAVDWYEKE